jgi:hypothetical protein
VLGIAGAAATSRLLRLRPLPIAAPLATATIARPAAADAELRTVDLTRDEDGVFLAYQIDLELGRAVEEALGKAVPLFFVAEAEIYRDRWYWRDRRVASASRTWRVVYQPLTSNWRTSSPGGLAQNHGTRAEALAVVTRAARWRIAETQQIEEGSRHYLEFSWRLDTEQLARPMQIGIGNQPDWKLFVRRTLRIT